MKTIAKLMVAGVMLAGLGLGGCVHQDSYDGLMEANIALKAEKNQRLREENTGLNAGTDGLRNSALSGQRTREELQKYVEDLKGQNARLADKLAEWEKRASQIAIGPIDPATDAAIAELVRANPNILSYDQAKGMLRFTSDVTFASGSADLTENARTTISSLAKILTEMASAQQYDIRVVGHTDSQRMSGPTITKFHSNLMLSAFRAASVHDQLVSGGLASNKVEICGWGETRPSVANNANGNTAQNRRVEVYLVRSTLGSADLPPPERPTTTNTAKPSTTPSKPANNVDIMK